MYNSTNTIILNTKLLKSRLTIRSDSKACKLTMFVVFFFNLVDYKFFSWFKLSDIYGMPT